MNQETEFKEGIEYSEEVKNAVRYGYQYRLEAEKNTNENIRANYCLPEATDILLWMANMVICGITYDVIKKLSLSIWQKLMRMKVEIPNNVNKVLIEDDELRKFVKYVSEFNDKKLSTTEKETSYIRGEICADYVGKKASEIYKKYQRIPTVEEHLTINRDANTYADKLLINEMSY